MQIGQEIVQIAGQNAAQGIAGRVDGGRIGRDHAHGHFLLGRQAQQKGLEGRFSSLIVQGPAHGGGELLFPLQIRRAAGTGANEVAGQALSSLPAIEQVWIGGQQDIAVLRRGVGLQMDRG